MLCAMRIRFSFDWGRVGRWCWCKRGMRVVRSTIESVMSWGVGGELSWGRVRPWP